METEHIPYISPATPESVWAAFRETDRLIKESRVRFEQEIKESRAERERSAIEFDRKLEESRAEREREMKESRAAQERSAIEFDRKLEESRAKFEQEMKESRAEREREMKESRAEQERSRIEFDRKLEESRAKFEQDMKESRAEFEQELKKSRTEHDKRMKDLANHIGGMANTRGDFSEEYFFNSFQAGNQNFFGEKFDLIDRRRVRRFKGGLGDEYDIRVINGESLGIIEVKFKAQKEDIPKVLKKAVTLRANYPEYKEHRVYLGLASMVFDPAVEEMCINEGIAIIKQVGDTVVFNNTNLKVF